MALHESTRLIKARSSRSGLGTATAFNYDDLRRQCDEFVAQAREQGGRLLAAAATEAEEIRRRAHAEGLAAGHQEGLDSAQNLIEARATEIAAGQTQARLKAVLPAFEEAVRALELERDRWLASWEGAAIGLAAAIAEKILRHELSRRPELGAAAIREALQLAAGQPHVRLHLHPLDLAQLQSCGHEALGRLAAVAEAEFVPDESIAAGGCVIETRHGVIDAQLETQLARIAQELLDT
ncbi:MAG: hypothetical protein HY290_22790 [Planctomycetia bacterium]|nr:hypothetical protein [Planctomycetia bacterium]